MSKETSNLEILSTREGFNSAVRHMNKTIDIVGMLSGKDNLGDILYERGDENLSGERAALLLRMLLVDKFGYKSVSSNLESIAADVSSLAEEFGTWKAVDLVAAYHHPDMGLIIANPKIAEELGDFGMLKKRELLVVYAGKGQEPADESCQKAAELAVAIFEGKKAKVSADLLKGGFGVRKVKKTAAKDEPAETAAPAKRRAAKAKPKKNVKSAKAAAEKATPVSAPVREAPPAVAKGPVRMTPLYSVVVSNELFHNGNVEAWKRIVASYKASYPNLEVYIYYEGERIMDINSLFKWGKVKHGSSIQFAVAGANIQDVAKLKRYLVQGASHMFEAFLHGPVNSILRLFG